MARKEVHPAIVDLLAVAISQAHGMPGLFHKVGEFPTETDPEYPISQGAHRGARSGHSDRRSGIQLCAEAISMAHPRTRA